MGWEGREGREGREGGVGERMGGKGGRGRSEGLATWPRGHLDKGQVLDKWRWRRGRGSGQVEDSGW
jgi:hypothetical protein